jgi:hypothetical protein
LSEKERYKDREIGKKGRMVGDWRQGRKEERNEVVVEEREKKVGKK